MTSLWSPKIEKRIVRHSARGHVEHDTRRELSPRSCRDWGSSACRPGGREGRGRGRPRWNRPCSTPAAPALSSASPRPRARGPRFLAPPRGARCRHCRRGRAEPIPPRFAFPRPPAARFMSPLTRTRGFPRRGSPYWTHAVAMRAPAEIATPRPSVVARHWCGAKSTRPGTAPLRARSFKRAPACIVRRVAQVSRSRARCRMTEPRVPTRWNGDPVAAECERLSSPAASAISSTLGGRGERRCCAR
jgi:hypothetical protein